jgi:hypothetical protein
MSVGWKAGRVSQLFGVQVQNSFATELLHFCFFLTAVRLLQNSALRYDCDQLGGLVLLFMAVLSDGHGQLPPCHHH